MPFANTDLSFYGGLGARLFGTGLGTFQPWQTQQAQSPYVGFSSYVPQDLLPGSAAGFLRSYMPELGGLENLSGLISPELRSSYQEFAGQPLQPGGIQEYLRGLRGREDVQALVRRGELQTENPLLQGEGEQTLGDVVQQLLGQEGSAISKLYGQYGADVATEDIRNLLTGQQSALGGLESIRQFGGSAATGRQLSAEQRQALGAQLLGGGAMGAIGLGGGQAFNPFSAGILSGEYRLGDLNLAGTDLQEFSAGLLSTQNLDLTQNLIGGLTGGAASYGGTGGYSLLNPLRGMSLGEGQRITQSGQLASWIDQLYAGRAGRGFAPSGQLGSMLQPTI